MAPRFNLPPLTKYLLATLFIFTLLNAILRPYSSWVEGAEKAGISKGDGAPYLAIVPRQSIVYPWVCLTAALVEQNIFGLLITGATVFYGGRYLERAWGSSEFAKFILFVAMIPNILSWVLYYLFFALSGSDRALNTTISGGIQLQAAFLVAFKQLVPEHTVAIAKGFIRMRVKHFPAIFLLGNTVSGLVFGTETALFLAWFGFFTSWIYLRFYRTSPSLSSTATGESGTVKGDASDTFSFAHFFPDPVQTVLAPVADKVYDTLVTLRICSPFSDEDIDAGNEQASARAEGGLPSLMNVGGRAGRGGGRREEAERRRALALKALDQRLHAAANRPHTAAAPPATAVPSIPEETNYEVERGERPPKEAQA
ncbi:hypothetical protein W97_07120 [Coniosporium apollinis CBS 100218]|uniref:DUF1751-domain-containing protein n=1 Tax=Coniosporium apollinis (strain CBS 100218) TaxID=1168221 RepID=R7Z1Q1_CONA1|nr:uncharacterized protein W97_07120 [Coniosporium apollinis CBS 100218]EON67974.1 hypothetical protein W97_07120 [Coniosporium apollinis CBS 100218]